MEPSPLSKLEPGVYQGMPDNLKEKNNSTVRPIRTMKSDAAEAIRDQEETTVSITIAEQKKRARLQAEALATKQTSAETATAAPKRLGRFIVIVILFLVIALLGAGYMFVLPKLSVIKLPSVSLPSFNKPPDTTTVTTTDSSASVPANSLIATQSEKRFNITKDARGQISKEIKTELVGGDTVGAIKNLYFTEDEAGGITEVSANRLIAFSGAEVPEMLIRSLEKSFMTGLLVESVGTSTPFMILKVSEKELSFAGMLEWESSLPAFFDNIFGTNIGSGVLPGTKFRDFVALGKDARIISSATGDTIAYTFVDNTTLVIAGSRSALETLIPLAAKN